MDTKEFSWGIKELDELYGPIPGGYTVIIEGKPGTGKTSLALQLLSRNIDKGYHALYISTNEDRNKLLKVAESIGVELGKAIESGRVSLLSIPIINDTSVVEFLTKSVMERIHKGIEIVVIDSITPLLKILKDYGLKRSFIHTTLYQVFRQENLLLVLIADKLNDHDEDLMILEYIADVIVELSTSDYGEKSTVHKLILKKFRGRNTSINKLFISFTRNGIRVLNYVSKDVIEKIHGSRKPVEVTCPAAKKIFGENITPGTQILVYLRGVLAGAKNFAKYLQMLVEKAVKTQGYNVGLISIHTQVQGGTSYLQEHIEIAKKLGNKLLIYRVDPGISSGEDLLSFEKELVLEKNAGIIVIHGLEKIAHMYGEEAIDIHAPYILEIQRKLGTIGIRLFISPTEDVKPPKTYYIWSDIVIEIYPDKKGEYIIRSIKRDESSKAKDVDFAECVEKKIV